MKKTLLTPAILLLSLLILRPTVYAQDPIALLEDMVKATENINTLMYTQKKWERINGNMHYENALFKINRKPLKVYMKQYTPRENLEVIYKQGWNDGEAKVNAGKFIPNLNLEIDGSRMRENQHHNITAAGFDQMADITRKLKSKYGDKAKSMVKYLGKVTWDGRTCHKIEMENPNWGYKSYTVKAGEDLIDIAKKYALSEHMILEANNLGGYDEVRTGQRIRIPTDYAKKTVILLDAKNMMPVKTVVYDDKGLYARYEFYNLIVNPPLDASHWDPDNDNYGF